VGRDAAASIRRAAASIRATALPIRSPSIASAYANARAGAKRCWRKL
jgi:hypothetical protein